ncbi:MAG: 1-acyl-sn-glycerol-3-phosphate acyltransferase [Bacteroidales bacterium]|nr:1-acyl-sn-glycerol-3-phosphate acyltransferase [Bacteroidales bacterium]
MRNILLRLYAFFYKRHPLMVVVLTLLLALMALCLLRLDFVEDISRFLPQEGHDNRQNYAYQNIGAANKIMINVYATQGEPDQEKIMDAVDRMAERLGSPDVAEHTTDVFYQVNEEKVFELTNFVQANMPYYLDSADYARIDSLLTPQRIAQALAADKQVLLSPAGGVAKKIIVNDPLGFVSPKLQQLGGGNPMGDSYEIIDGYVFNKEGTEAIMAVTSKYPVSETSGNKKLVQQIDKIAHEVEDEFAGTVKVDYIGAAVISVENADRIKTDSIISTILALVLILALLMYFFRDARALIIIVFSITFGALFGLAFLALFKGTVSVIAIGVGSIIVGIAVNYPLHFLAHYQQGYSKEQTIKDIIEPLVTGNLTTVGAFLSLVFISSDAMKDLGLFAALLLVGTILFVLVFLPHLFRKTLFHKQDRSATRLVFGKVADRRFEQNKIFVLAIVLITIPLYYFSRQTAFESDMSKINYMTPDQRTKLDKLIAQTESGVPSVYCVAEGKDMEEALRGYEAAMPVIESMAADSTVVKVSGIGGFVPSQQMQKQRVEQWEAFWSTRRDDLVRNVEAEAAKLGYSKGALQPFFDIIGKSHGTHEYTYFEPIINSFASNYLCSNPDRCMVYTLMESNDREAVAQRLGNVDDAVFTMDNTSIVDKMVDALSDDFDYVLYICGFIVFLFLTISFGRLELSLLSFLPLAVGWIWILGIMNIFDIRFNIINIILATFIFGQGDDYTIFVTEGMMYEYTYRRKMLASYKNSVLLSATIMFIGIGSLIIAKHPAMHSLAEVTIIGMFCVVLMAYIFPPLIYRWLTKRKGVDRKMPITLFNLLKTVFAFLVFAVFSIFLLFWGFFVITIGGKRPANKLFYHKCLRALLATCVKLLPGVSFKLHNDGGEDFSKPSVIICNHQSHLDLLYTLALHPKIICLTNKKMWNSPFYGWILRYADFYPVSDGFDNCEEHVAKAISNGYSVLVFPEGTRSETCDILRFHKGAFQLAKTLGVDVLPLIIHGIGHAFPKRDFLLRKGKVDLYVMPRIAADSELMQKDSAEIAKTLRRYYTEQYDEICRRTETADYFADLVLHNYIYKGRDIERRARKNLRQNGNYREAIAALPDNGEYRIENCGQGEFALLAALVKKNLQITATDSDADLVDIAANCVSVPQNLKYEHPNADE